MAGLIFFWQHHATVRRKMTALRTKYTRVLRWKRYIPKEEPALEQPSAAVETLPTPDYAALEGEIRTLEAGLVTINAALEEARLEAMARQKQERRAQEMRVLLDYLEALRIEQERTRAEEEEELLFLLMAI